MENKVDMLTREQVVRKEFGYKKGDVNLAFQLRMNVKDLSCFKQLLEAAIEDVNAELIKVSQ